MTVAKVTTDSYGNLGIQGSRLDNEMVAINGIILCTPDFEHTIADLALEATWVAGIRAKQVFPLKIDGYEDQSSEDTIFEYPSESRKLLKRGKTRYMFNSDAPLEQHRTLHRYFNNANVKLFTIRDGRLCFYNDGGTGKGFTLSMVNIGRMTEVPADGSSPANTPIYLDIQDSRQWDIYGDFLEPSWNINDLDPLTSVNLEVVGTPTSSSVVIRVYTNDGYDEAGVVKKIGIKGIVEADFALSLTGAATGFTDNADGTYSFTSSAAFATGTVNLVAATAMTSDGLLIDSTGAASVTI